MKRHFFLPALCACLLCSLCVFAQRRHYSGDITTAAEYEALPLAATPSNRDITDLPPRVSLKDYTPAVRDQGEYSTCVAWSCAYAARTISYAIQHNLTNKDSIAKYTFSPGFLFYFIKKPSDNGCQVGSNILRALDSLSTKGVVLFKDGVQDCTDAPPPLTEDYEAENFKIKGANRISQVYGQVSQNNIGEIKKALNDKNPVVISMRLTSSFEDATMPATGIWQPLPNEQPKPNDLHAMCVVGYDDNVNGGSFEVMNSWGQDWGNKGFFWLKYTDLLNYGASALSLVDYEGSPHQTLAGSIDFVMLNGTPMPVTRQKVDSRSLSVVSDDQAYYSQYRMPQVYPGGTSFRLKFTTSAPAYVYIVSEDNNHVISPIFPDDPSISPAINSSNTTIFLPSETKYVRLDPAPAKEHICVLYSKDKLDLQGLEAYMKSSGKTIPQAVQDKYGDRLVDLKSTNFSDSAIKFSAPAGDGKIVCFFIELEHN